MMQKIITFCNENHWYIIAGVLLILITIMIYGCQSQVESIITPGKMVCRAELENELQYMIGQVNVKIEDLNRQDEMKQALLTGLSGIGAAGTINPIGLLNLATTVGAISFGLNRNQKYKEATKSTTTTQT